MTWFGVGGPAETLFLPADAADLTRFLAAIPEDVPLHILGATSNSLVRDGGIDGVTIRLMGRAWNRIAVDENGDIVAGGGALLRQIASSAARSGRAGLEFFSGIPGTVGGALAMNAGCHGSETADTLIEAKGVDRAGREVTLPPESFAFSYRRARIPPGIVLVSARFRSRPDTPAAIAARMERLARMREASQPLRARTGGSTFANPDPPGTPVQRKAWKLLDSAGMRGARLGGAAFSDKHCNFLINTGNATARELETLAERARDAVREKSGVDLRWEIRRVGRPA